MSNPADRPATEPRPTTLDDLIRAARDWGIEEASQFSLPSTLAAHREEVEDIRAAIEAEAAQGAAPRAEGLEREAAAATPSLQREVIESWSRLQDAYDALRAAILWLHGEYRDTDRSEFNAQAWYRKARSGSVGLRDFLTWRVGKPADLFERALAEAAQGAAPRAEGLDAIAFLDSLRTPRNSLGKLALPKGPMEWAVEEAWVPPAVEELDDTGDGVMIHRLSELADLIIDRLQARLSRPSDERVPESEAE